MIPVAALLNLKQYSQGRYQPPAPTNATRYIADKSTIVQDVFDVALGILIFMLVAYVVAYPLYQRAGIF